MTSRLPTLSRNIERRFRHLSPSMGEKLLREYRGLDWAHYRLPEPLRLTVVPLSPVLAIAHWPRGLRMRSHHLLRAGVPFKVLDGLLTVYETMPGGIKLDSHLLPGDTCAVPGCICMARKYSMTLHIGDYDLCVK